MTADIDRQRRELDTQIAHWTLSGIAAAIHAAAQPALAIVPTTMDVPLGRSRFGGLPDLPAGMDYPLLADGWPVFVAQIALGDLPPMPGSPLPTTGMLYWFCGNTEPAHAVPHRVIYASATGDLRPVAPPPGVPKAADPEITGFAPCALTFTPILTLPDEGGRAWAAIRAAAAPHYSDDPDGWIDRYFALRADLAAAVAAQPLSFLLGWPTSLGSDLSRAAAQTRAGRGIFEQPAPTADEARPWRLLLEIASHDAAGMLWWDNGRLQYLIHADDLAAHDYSRTYCCITSA